MGRLILSVMERDEKVEKEKKTGKKKKICGNVREYGSQEECDTVMIHGYNTMS